nr:hypothetical protein [Pantoea septica]
MMRLARHEIKRASGKTAYKKRSGKHQSGSTRTRFPDYRAFAASGGCIPPTQTSLQGLQQPFAAVRTENGIDRQFNSFIV